MSNADNKEGSDFFDVWRKIVDEYHAKSPLNKIDTPPHTIPTICDNLFDLQDVLNTDINYIVASNPYINNKSNKSNLSPVIIKTKCQYKNEICERLGKYPLNGLTYCYKHYSSSVTYKCNVGQFCHNVVTHKYPGKHKTEILACTAHANYDMFPIDTVKCISILSNNVFCNYQASTYLLGDPERKPIYCVRHAKYELGLNNYGEYASYSLREYKALHNY